MSWGRWCRASVVHPALVALDIADGPFGPDSNDPTLTFSTRGSRGAKLFAISALRHPTPGRMWLCEARESGQSGIVSSAS